MCAGGGRILSLGGWISGAYSVFQWENYWHPEWGRTVLFTAGHLASLAILLWISGPLPFWHQGPVLWKTVFPQTTVVGRMVSGWFKHSYDSKESACNARDAAWSLGLEDPLEEEMATHSSILAWEILWTKNPGWLQSLRSQKSWTQLSD